MFFLREYKVQIGIGLALAVLWHLGFDGIEAMLGHILAGVILIGGALLVLSVLGFLFGGVGLLGGGGSTRHERKQERHLKQANRELRDLNKQIEKVNRDNYVRSLGGHTKL